MSNEQQPVEEITESNWHQVALLSENAAKVYDTIVFLLKDRKQTEIWLDDAQLSRRSRILIQYIPGIQSELARSGLLHMTPGENRIKYELVSEDEAGQ